MAKRKSSRQGNSGRNSASPPRRVIPKALDEAIEAERSVLMKADAVLNCLALAMDYDDGANIPRPYYAIIVELARDLVNDSISRLDSVNLEAALRTKRVGGRKAGAQQLMTGD